MVDLTEKKRKHSERTQIWKKNNPEKVKKYRRSIPVKYKDYVHDATNRRNLVFALNMEQFTTLVTSLCFYCGDCGGGIDRKDNNIGYVLENCLPCCITCNRLKQAKSYEDFTTHIIKIADNLKLKQ